MNTVLRLISFSSALAALLSTASVARAQDNGPCGKFDFSGGLDCRIEVEGGCEVQCRPLNFEVACAGGCTAEATTTCSGSCEAMCNAQCNPAQIDCNAGCDMECESRCLAACDKEDCTQECGASCSANCDASCTGQALDCEASCQECCHGACTTEVNIDCDLQCYAEMEGGCAAQCQAPSGALFCNGQYVGASDVDACIQHLLTQGIEVNVEARGQVTCGLDGCQGTSNVTGLPDVSGCSAAPVGSLAVGSYGAAAIAAGGLAAALVRRRRDRKA